MKRVTAAFALAIAALSFTAVPAQAQAANSPHLRQPMQYRFPILPRRHALNENRPHRHLRHRHHRRPYYLSGFRGPAVIYRNGYIGIPPEHDALEPAVPVIAHPVVYRLGETSGCDVEHLNVRSSRGRITVNVWRC